MKELDFHQSISKFLQEARKDRSVFMGLIAEIKEVVYDSFSPGDFVFEAEEIVFETQREREIK